MAERLFFPSIGKVKCSGIGVGARRRAAFATQFCMITETKASDFVSCLDSPNSSPRPHHAVTVVEICPIDSTMSSMM